MSTAQTHHSNPDNRLGTPLRHAIDTSAVLTREQEVDLFTRIRASKATTGPLVDKALRANLKLCASLARTTCWNSNVPLADRYQLACLGCLTAIAKFDPTMGNKFITFATPWIKQAIQRGVINTGETIRVPVHMVETRQQIMRATQKLRQAADGAEPSVEAVVAKSNEGRVSAKVYKPLHVRKVAQLPVTVSTDTSYRSAGVSVMDFLADEEQVDVAEQMDAARKAAALETALHHLDERTAAIMRQRLGIQPDGARVDGESTAVIAERLNLSRERVRQLEVKGVKTLRVLIPVLMIPEGLRTKRERQMLTRQAQLPDHSSC